MHGSADSPAVPGLLPSPSSKASLRSRSVQVLAGLYPLSSFTSLRLRIARTSTGPVLELRLDNLRAVTAKGSLPNRRRPLREDASPCQVAISDKELSSIEKGLRKTNVLLSLLVIETYLLIKVVEGPEWGYRNPPCAELVDDTV